MEASAAQPARHSPCAAPAGGPRPSARAPAPAAAHLAVARAGNPRQLHDRRHEPICDADFVWGAQRPQPPTHPTLPPAPTRRLPLYRYTMHKAGAPRPACAALPSHACGALRAAAGPATAPHRVILPTAVAAAALNFPQLYMAVARLSVFDRPTVPSLSVLRPPCSPHIVPSLFRPTVPAHRRAPRPASSCMAAPHPPWLLGLPGAASQPAFPRSQGRRAPSALQAGLLCCMPLIDGRRP